MRNLTSYRKEFHDHHSVYRSRHFTGLYNPLAKVDYPGCLCQFNWLRVF